MVANCVAQDCGRPAKVKRAKDGRPLCQDCFISAFEQEVHETIMETSLFERGETVAIGASGGKDSTVLAYLMQKLNTDHDYGLNLLLLSIDEGITGYRDDSLKAVERNKEEYGLPLTIISYKAGYIPSFHFNGLHDMIERANDKSVELQDLYGWTMDDIVAKIGKKNNCTFCGVFRRQALDRGAHRLGASKLLTGHNADDMAETVLMNVLRGDTARLERCTAICTAEGGSWQLPRAKPLKFCYEKDIVMYARLRQLHYFYTECIYAPNSYRQFARTFVKRLERTRPQAIIDLIRSAENLSIKKDVVSPVLSSCTRCGYISSQPLCKACLLLEGLNTNNTSLGVKKGSSGKGKDLGGGCSSSGDACACSADTPALNF